MEIFAHRGASGSRPENTLAAFREAAGLPIDGVELDVHLSGDGVPVVIHDETVDRTTDGSGYVKAMTVDELKQLSAGCRFSDEYYDERIPTLREVLELFRGKPHRLNIELKSDVFPYPGMRQKVIALVREFGIADQVILSSFDHVTLEAVKREAPEIETGMLFVEILADARATAARISADALHPALPYAVREPGRQAAAEGAVLRVYTVNEPEYAVMAREAGAQAIFTDYPDRMLKLFK
ncbi:glycerophosphodiester phosphodiesterase [Bhargavaea beijingensis]|uniref:Glycerophosphodiester phosphodiesterase n=1 Tax=Bhargavaea beijingensis TaxID=426756 RepID=A0A1G7G2P1_9BACL|nr:glycerophosphodiester phosphodiesterase [Bhargavaea beijingensis]RSK35775.1 glycerophosphodiester phosphodiesterase [Bhargavaea beijingensis]SDE82411.1 glycerophosphoryl diester phosphodiesterase [Bhargavaea beijingensis]